MDLVPATTITQSVGATAVADTTPITPERFPLLFDALNRQPSLKVTTGFQMARGSQTILRGGWGVAADQTFWDTMKPKSFLRHPTMDAFSMEKGHYSPFQAASMVNSAGGFLKNRGMLNYADDTPLMTNGLLGQFSAASQVRRMGSTPIGADLAGNLGDFTTAIKDPMTFTAETSGRDAAMLMGRSGGIINQAVMGFNEGVLSGNSARQFIDLGGHEVYDKAAAFGAKHFGPEVAELGVKGAIGEARDLAIKGGVEFGAKEAAKVGAETGLKLAARGGIMAANLAAGPVGWAMDAWMAYDVAKLGFSLINDGIIKPMAQLRKDATKSFMGQINKPVMGMGFVDNSVAATSRSRGVMAIQNSRLNARSILGDEGGMMASHFG